jgi:hypothetical protein
MSRDPEDGKPIDPKTLHKYLYAGGDPVNRFDSSGRDFTDYVVTAVWVAQTSCYVLGGSDVLYELEFLKEYGHFVDPGIPVKWAFACGVVGLLPS